MCSDWQAKSNTMMPSTSSGTELRPNAVGSQESVSSTAASSVVRAAPPRSAIRPASGAPSAPASPANPNRPISPVDR